MAPSNTGEMLEKILLVLAIFGIIISVWLTWHHYWVNYQNGGSDWCDITDKINCDTIARSEYAAVHGVPAALLGLFWFAVAAAFAFPFTDKILKGKSHLFLLGWSVLGLLAIFSFIHAEFVLGVWCVACTLAHATGIGIFGIALINYKIHRKVEDGNKS